MNIIDNKDLMLKYKFYNDFFVYYNIGCKVYLCFDY